MGKEEPTFEELLEQLKHENPDMRRRAAAALGTHKDAIKAVNSLKEAIIKEKTGLVRESMEYHLHYIDNPSPQKFIPCRRCKKGYTVGEGYYLCYNCFEVEILDERAFDHISYSQGYLDRYYWFYFSDEMKEELSQLESIKQKMIQKETDEEQLKKYLDLFIHEINELSFSKIILLGKGDLDGRDADDVILSSVGMEIIRELPKFLAENTSMSLPEVLVFMILNIEVEEIARVLIRDLSNLGIMDDNDLHYNTEPFLRIIKNTTKNITKMSSLVEILIKYEIIQDYYSDFKFNERVNHIEFVVNNLKNTDEISKSIAEATLTCLLAYGVLHDEIGYNDERRILEELKMKGLLEQIEDFIDEKGMNTIGEFIEEICEEILDRDEIKKRIGDLYNIDFEEFKYLFLRVSFFLMSFTYPNLRSSIIYPSSYYEKRKQATGIIGVTLESISLYFEKAELMTFSQLCDFVSIEASEVVRSSITIGGDVLSDIIRDMDHVFEEIKKKSK